MIALDKIGSYLSMKSYGAYMPDSPHTGPKPAAGIHRFQ